MMLSIKDTVNEGIINHQLHDILMIPSRSIISDCVKQFNQCKDNGSH